MDDKIIKIASFFDYTQAEIAKIALESEGIECFLSGENFVATYWLYANADGGIKLYIKESDRQKAESVLKTIHKPDEANKDLNYDLRCPKCGGTDIDYIQNHKGFSVITIILLSLLSPLFLIWGSPLALWRDANQCKSCGHKWKQEVSTS